MSRSPQASIALGVVSFVLGGCGDTGGYSGFQSRSGYGGSAGTASLPPDAAGGTANWTTPDATGGSQGSGASGGAAGVAGSGGSAGGAGDAAAGTGGVTGAGGSGGGGGTTLRLSMGPIDVAAGSEVTLCIDIRMPTTEPFELVSVSSELTPGGHHMIVYTSGVQNEARTPFPCSAALDIADPNMVPLFIAQQPHTNLAFPPGVAYQLPAARMMRIELHFFNAGRDPIKAGGTVDFTGADPASIAERSNFMFWGPTGLFIAPQSSATATRFYRFDKRTPPSIFGLTTHTHSRGVRTTVQMGPDGAGRQVYENTHWEEPPLKVFDPPLVAASASDGLRLSCEYVNPTTSVLVFGESAQNNEMCFLWAYYFPDEGSDRRVDP